MANMSDDSDTIWRKLRQGVFVIAEAGKNFIQTKEDRPISEYLANAKKLVDAAVGAGADAIKFQTHNVEDEQLNVPVTSPHFQGSDRYNWVRRNTDATPLEDFWMPLKKYCDRKGIIFFSTPMSRGAAVKLSRIGVRLWKIGSADILDFPMMDYVRRSGLPIIISSGMSTLEELEAAIEFLKKKNNKIALLHCVSQYPCPPEKLRLKTIEFYKEKFSAKDVRLPDGRGLASGEDVPVGFSDHSLGVDSSLAAAALGATIIEKHFSLSRRFWGADHRISMTPSEFTALTAGVRKIFSNQEKQREILNDKLIKRSIGGGKIKILQKEEATLRPLFRKSLVAAEDIPAGTLVTAEMVYAMRPQLYSRGFPSENFEKIVGRKTAKDLKKYDPINESALI